jgi:hypothetical protein
MNGYAAFWNGKRIEVYAKTAYEAQQVAAEKLGKRCKRWDVAVVITEIDGKPVTHSTNEF